MGADVGIALLVEELCRHDAEAEWIEFKTNSSNPEMVGQRIGALANSACRLGAPTAYMVWGIDDEAHEVAGSSFRHRLKKKGNEELGNWPRHRLTDNASFEFAEGEVGGMHVTVLMVHAAFHHTVDFERVPYVRVGSYTKRLREYPAMGSEVWDRITKFDFESVTARGACPFRTRSRRSTSRSTLTCSGRRCRSRGTRWPTTPAKTRSSRARMMAATR